MCKTAEDLDMDVVSVSAKFPEDIFDIFEPAMEIHSSSDYQRDSKSGTEPELETSSLKLIFPLKDSRRNINLKITAKVSKELYVKLTPVSLFPSPIQGTECQEVTLEKDFNENTGMIPVLEKCGAREGVSKSQHSGESKVTSLLGESDVPRTLHVKIKPLRQETEAKLSISDSNEESNETLKEKKNLSVLIRKKDQQNSFVTAIDNPRPYKVPKAKQARTVDQSSDPNEI